MNPVELSDPPSLEELFNKSVEDLKTAELKLSAAESDFETQASQDNIPLDQFQRLESTVRYLNGCVESHKGIVRDLEAQLSKFREKANRQWEIERKKQRKAAILTELDTLSSELRRLQAEYSALPPQMQKLQFRHSQLLRELSHL